MEVLTRTPSAAVRERLAAYLHFGYLPELEPAYRDSPWARVRASDVLPAGACARDELLARGAAAFRAACESAGGGLNVVPLSGGVDSRLILAALLEAGLRERVVTVTFGVPGTLDFELGCRVARAAGVRHEALDLRALPVTRAELLELATRAPWSFLLEVFYGRTAFRRHGSAATYWSGNLSNALAGGDDGPPCAWGDTCRKFARGMPGTRVSELVPPGFRPESALPAHPPLEDAALTPFEQLLAFVRNPGRNDPGQLPAGFDVRAPFRREGWVAFVLRVPRVIRRELGFYHELAARAAPALFAAPLKNYLGLPLGSRRWRYELRRARYKARRVVKARFPRLVPGPDPKLNYADFDAELRAPTPLREVVEESLARLEESRVVPWLRPRELLARHRRFRANLGDALVLLASLELNLAANGPPPSVRSG